MNPSYRAECVILKRTNAREADRIVTVYSKQYGKLRVLARGVRKITSKRGPHIELFQHVELQLYRHQKIDSISEIMTYSDVKSTSWNIESIGFAYYFIELVDLLTPEGQKNEDVFSILLSVLQTIGQPASMKTKSAYIVKSASELLWCLGFLPEQTYLMPKEIVPFIERIVERRMKTPEVLKKIFVG